MSIIAFRLSTRPFKEAEADVGLVPLGDLRLTGHPAQMDGASVPLGREVHEAPLHAPDDDPPLYHRLQALVDAPPRRLMGAARFLQIPPGPCAPVGLHVRDELADTGLGALQVGP